jgi:magnesium transporter
MRHRVSAKPTSGCIAIRILIPKRSKKAGLPPGTIVHVGEEKHEKIKVSVIGYDKDHFQEKEAEKVEDCFALENKPVVQWINIDGVHQLDIIEQIGAHFGFHPLVMEDIANTDQRPKTEDYGDYVFVVLKMLQFNEEKNQTLMEQVSIIFGADFVVSFQEAKGDVFNLIRERIRSNKGRIRKMGADYLAYSLVDAIVDNYFVILEKLGEKIEEIEDKLVTDPKPETLQTIHDLKREMVFLRKSVWPLREVISRLERYESPLINKSTGVYLRDVYDHTIQVIDSVETFRDMLSGMLEIYLSSLSNRMNEVMKVLTVIATIFIPLTFVAGLYGMNFKFMPELDQVWGYPAALSSMLVVALVMVVYFKRKRWI